jgi:hypothetical protein
MPTNKEEKEAGWLSVTEVLDAFIPKGLLNWYLKTGAKEAKRLSTAAMKIGTRVDELIQQDINEGSYKLSAKDLIEVKNCMEAWRQFKSDYSPKIVDCQKEVKDEENKITGHIDLLTDRVIDVKCSSSIKDSYWLQTCKYSEMNGFSLGPAILRLDKNLATYEYKTIEQTNFTYGECVRVFDGLLKAYRFYNKPKGQEDV